MEKPLHSQSLQIGKTWQTSNTGQTEPTELTASKLKADPRIGQAKKLLAAALKEHSLTIDAVRSPNPELVPHYQDALTRLAKNFYIVDCQKKS